MAAPTGQRQAPVGDQTRGIDLRRRPLPPEERPEAVVTAGGLDLEDRGEALQQRRAVSRAEMRDPEPVRPAVSQNRPHPRSPQRTPGRRGANCLRCGIVARGFAAKGVNRFDVPARYTDRERYAGDRVEPQDPVPFEIIAGDMRAPDQFGGLRRRRQIPSAELLGAAVASRCGRCSVRDAQRFELRRRQVSSARRRGPSRRAVANARPRRRKPQNRSLPRRRTRPRTGRPGDKESAGCDMPRHREPRPDRPRRRGPQTIGRSPGWPRPAIRDRSRAADQPPRTPPRERRPARSTPTHERGD